MNIHTRHLEMPDFQAMRELLLTEGPNEWNYITDESIAHQFQLIADGTAMAVLAEDEKIAGFSVVIFGQGCPQKLSKYDDLSEIAYIKDVVVSSSQSGKGLGTLLLEESIGQARTNRLKKVYIERHEENLASAGMMRKAGFEIVETLHDPQKRATGSRNTSVLSVCT